jgi:hypothetical protein
VSLTIVYTLLSSRATAGSAAIQVIDRFVDRYRAADENASRQSLVFSSPEETKLGNRLTVWRGRGFSAREIYDAF